MPGATAQPGHARACGFYAHRTGVLVGGRDAGPRLVRRSLASTAAVSRLLAPGGCKRPASGLLALPGQGLAPGTLTGNDRVLPLLDPTAPPSLRRLQKVTTFRAGWP